MLFTCLNLLPAIGFEQRIYDVLEYVDVTSPQFNNKSACIMKKDKIGYGSIDKAFTILNKMYTLNELGDNTTGITAQFYSMGRLCDIRSPYFFITVFGDGSIKIFNPEYQGNIRTLNDNDVIDIRRKLFDTANLGYYNNIWTENALLTKAWNALDNVIIFKGNYEYSFGQNVSYKGINYFVVAREYNQELEEVLNYAVLLTTQDTNNQIVPLSMGVGVGIAKSEEIGGQTNIEFFNGLIIKYVIHLNVSGNYGSGFSEAIWYFSKPFKYGFWSGVATPLSGYASWHQCMINMVEYGDRRYNCKIVCRGRDEKTWAMTFRAFAIGT